MLLIWFNSIDFEYEIGTKADLLTAMEYYGFEFEILYEFNAYNLKIAQKVADRLNMARVERLA